MTAFNINKVDIGEYDFYLSECKWSILFLAYLIYSIFFLIGFAFDLQLLNFVGVALLFYLIIIGRYKKLLTIRKDPTILISFSIVFLLIINAIINIQSIKIIYFVKIISIYLLYILIFSYKIQPFYVTNKRIYFLGLIIVILFLSLILGRYYEHGNFLRLKGLFVNPNNLALMSFAIFFTINEEKDSKIKQLFAISFVITILFLSGTTGALLSFFIAVCYRYRNRFTLKHILLLLMLVGLIMVSINLFEVPIVRKVYNQFKIIGESFIDTIQGQQPNYGEIVALYDKDSLSGIWRIAHWTNIFNMLFQSNYKVLLFGHGIGTSVELLGTLPHNDYLRIAFEAGLVVFILNLFFFVQIFLHIKPNYRYILLLFAIYCLTENIIDNYLYMGLLVFFIATSQQVRHKST
jgi:O-antigen ligase